MNAAPGINLQDSRKSHANSRKQQQRRRNRRYPESGAKNLQPVKHRQQVFQLVYPPS